jgi:ribose transport system permease protein/putative xylitol transport system permease protein
VNAEPGPAVLAEAAAPPIPGRRRMTRTELLSRYGMAAIFAILVVVLVVANESFRNPQNLINILQQNSIIGIVACGMLLMIVVGGFDLSVGAVGAMSGVVAAVVIINVGILPGVIVALLCGLGVGLLNGTLIAKIGINPFVATLGTQVLIYGLLFVATDARPVYGMPAGFTWLGLGKIGPVPVAVVVFAIVLVITWIVLRRTTFGQHIYAVGGGRDASWLAGVNVDRVTVATYGIGSLFAALAGLVLLGQTNIGQPATAEAWPLAAIAAVVVGGVPLTGGVGGVGAALLGTLLLGVVANGLNLFSVSPFWQPAITGLVILVAVGLDSYQRKRAGST